MATINIGIFGRRNAGKSSLINLLSGQDVSIVSNKAGTTTDPVKKRIEIFGLGPCQFIDTAGYDDSGSIGQMRVEKTLQVIEQIDIAILIFTANLFEDEEKNILNELIKKDIPTILLHNQSDIIELREETSLVLQNTYNLPLISFSCYLLDQERQDVLLQTLVNLLIQVGENSPFRETPMLKGLISKDNNIVLVCPIDSEAPTGRLILPQQMAIREVLDFQAIAKVMQTYQLENYFVKETNTDLVITDSQAFKEVAAITPENIPLTSFSMLLARSKGSFIKYQEGTPSINNLKNGDKILMLESCTHHSSCEDIGRVKLPTLFKKFTQKEIEFEYVTGLDSISNIESYALVVQCGGCMVTKRQLHNRLSKAIEKNIPVTNYGMAIAYMTGIYERAMKPLL